MLLVESWRAFPQGVCAVRALPFPLPFHRPERLAQPSLGRGRCRLGAAGTRIGCGRARRRSRRTRRRLAAPLAEFIYPIMSGGELLALAQLSRGGTGRAPGRLQRAEARTRTVRSGPSLEETDTARVSSELLASWRNGSEMCTLERK